MNMKFSEMAAFMVVQDMENRNINDEDQELLEELETDLQKAIFDCLVRKGLEDPEVDTLFDQEED